jgi:para-nitrobenzyl esterase
MDDRHMWLSGRFNPADLLVGNCENEGYLFTISDVQLETYPTFESNLSAVYGSLTPQAMAAYPVSAPGATGFNASDAMYQLGHFLGDPLLVYGSRQTARTLSQVNRNVFRYAFTRPAPGQNGPDTHICEIPFVFPGLYPITAQQIVPDPGAASYAATIVDAWSRFMKTGNPNGGQINNWPAYDKTDPDLNFTGAGPIPETGFRQQGLDAVDAYHRLNNP